MTGASGLAWDACALLNLGATARPQEILVALGSRSFCIKEVLEGEVLYIRALSEDDPSRGRVAVDLEHPVAVGALRVEVLTSTEIAEFVNLAVAMDDGEARTTALAVCRGLRLVTDDRLSLRVAGARGISTVTTPDWVKAWSDASQPAQSIVAETIRRIEECASYVPPRAHRLAAWWSAHRI